MKVITTKKLFGNDTRTGIHLLNPTNTELELAKNKALIEGFYSIYIHLSQQLYYSVGSLGKSNTQTLKQLKNNYDKI